MSTQYGRLLKTPPPVRDPALRAGLRGQSRAALEKFLQRCNATRSLDEQISMPPPGAGYPAYAPQLLAHLWAGAAVLPALQALAQLAGTPIPAAPSYSDMDGNLLRRLWELAEDGSALHQLLQRRDRFAEMELLRLYNRNRSAGRLEEPAPQDGYLAYPRVLLAVLWALVANADALRALGRQLRLNVPEPFCCDTMPDRLLGQLWRLGRDGTALRTLWHRRGLLPVENVDARTPEAVLGFLAWHEQRGDARDELLRRYCLLGATPGEFLQRFKRRRAPWPYESVDDFFQDVLVKFLEQVETWDYLGYPALEHRLFRSVRNLIIDRIRREARQPRATDPPVLEDAPAEESPDAAPVLAEEVPPLAFRVVLKAKFSVELTAEELDWSAGQNLEQRGLAAPTAEQRLRERQRIGAWLQQHPGPAGQQLAECFLWHAPCKFDRALRDWKLRQAANRAAAAAGRRGSGPAGPAIRRGADRPDPARLRRPPPAAAGDRAALRGATGGGRPTVAPARAVPAQPLPGR
jgi:DNA-directed RNA polymerase specialized sigma24 family protein